MALGTESAMTIRYDVATPKHLIATATSMYTPAPGTASSETERKLAGRPAWSAASERHTRAVAEHRPKASSMIGPKRKPHCANAYGSPSIPAPRMVLERTKMPPTRGVPEAAAPVVGGRSG